MLKKFKTIDWFIIIFILALLGLGFMKLSSKSSISKKSVQLTVAFEAKGENGNGVPIGLVDSIKNGDKIYNSVTDTYIGEVISVTNKPYKKLLINEEDKVEYREIPDEYNPIIKVKTNVKKLESGYTIENTKVLIGTKIRLRSMNYVFTGDIIDLEETEKKNDTKNK